MSNEQNTRPSAAQIVAELKARSGHDGYAVELDDDVIHAYSYASTPGTFNGARAAVYWIRGRLFTRGC